MAGKNPTASPAPQAPPAPKKPKKDYKTYEFKVYIFVNNYSGDTQLLTTVQTRFRDVTTDDRRVLAIARDAAEEYARNIGLFGITVENPQNIFTFYPPQRIASVQFDEVNV